MSFIDNTYFVGDINLTSGQLDNITNWITVYETEILKKLLGYTLYAELQADLVSGVPQTTKFIRLVNGYTFSFEFNGQTINEKWEGLKGLNKKSLIAYYVYYQYRNLNETFNTTAGQKTNVSENSQNVNAAFYFIYVWNKMVELYGVVPEYNESYFLNNDNYVHFNKLPSAYNYLLANIADFENWVYEPIYYQNIFGI